WRGCCRRAGLAAVLLAAGWLVDWRGDRQRACWLCARDTSQPAEAPEPDCGAAICRPDRGNVRPSCGDVLIVSSLIEVSMKNDPSYDRLLLLDRLEELREDMEELNVRSVEDLEARIAELEA